MIDRDEKILTIILHEIKIRTHTLASVSYPS